MYRKLAFSVVSVLGLMTLIVSAQQPPSGQLAPPGVVSGEPPQAPNLGVDQGWGFPQGNNPYANFMTPTRDNRSRKEESDLIRKSQELVKQLAKAEGDGKEKIMDQLRETTNKQFEIRQKRHEADLKALEDQVKKLKDMVQKRKDNRREIVGKRLEQLVRETEGLGW
jgi:hypothetical protein